MTSRESGNTNSPSNPELQKAYIPISFNPFGKLILVKHGVFQNAPYVPHGSFPPKIDTTVLGSVTFVIFVDVKALREIAVMPSGITISPDKPDSRNALSPIAVIPNGIVISDIPEP
jgi:hypothetical protein